MKLLSVWAFPRAVFWSRPAERAISLVCFLIRWQARSSTVWKLTPLRERSQSSSIRKPILPCRVLKKQSSQTTTLMWLSAMCRLAILRSTTAVTTPRSSLFTITFSQRLLIKFVRAVLLRSLPLREQWIRQAPKYASILLREPSCSELSDCLITLSEQTQAQRLRATFSFCRSVTE